MVSKKRTAKRAASAPARPPRAHDAEWVADLGHDLRLEVSAAAMLAQSIRNHPDLDEHLYPALDRLIAHLFDITSVIRREFHGHQSDPTVAADDQLAQLVELWRAERETTIDLTSTRATISTDLPTLHRIMVNLLDNAVRAAGPSGRVHVHVTEEDEIVEIGVDDSGPGFGLAPRGELGAGLRIVHRLVSEQGGEVVIEAAPLGGTRVRVRLPRAPLSAGPGRSAD